MSYPLLTACILNSTSGRDTTAQSLTWTHYLLLRHPYAQQQIIDELHSTLPPSPNPPPLSFDTVQPSSLPYTAAVFNEALRLYPPVPVELKECTAATTFPDGTWLPKGAIVIWSPWAMGRSRTIWGEDADEFRPERWLVDHAGENASQTLRSMSPFEFPVFNGGPRSCLGKRMAELLAVYVIARLTSRYEFEEIFDGVPKERRSQNSLTLPMEGGLPCYVRRRKS